MLGWFKAEAARASFSNRFRREGSEATSAGSTLMATSRESRVSRARQTSPIPPAPRGERISYGFSREPGVRAIRLGKVYASERLIPGWRIGSNSLAILSGFESLPPSQAVAPAPRGSCACGAPADGSPVGGVPDRLPAPSLAGALGPLSPQAYRPVFP